MLTRRRLADNLAAAYVGAAKTQYEGDEHVLNVTLGAMNWWFSRDFTNPECLVNGGTSTCPCGTPVRRLLYPPRVLL